MCVLNAGGQQRARLTLYLCRGALHVAGDYAAPAEVQSPAAWLRNLQQHVSLSLHAAMRRKHAGNTGARSPPSLFMLRLCLRPSVYMYAYLSGGLGVYTVQLDGARVALQFGRDVFLSTSDWAEARGTPLC